MAYKRSKLTGRKRPKNIKNEIIRFSKTDKIKYRNIAIRYDESTDEFITTLDISVKNHPAKIHGWLDARELAANDKAVKVVATTDSIKKGLSTMYSVRLGGAEAKHLWALIKGYVDTTGDVLDEGIFETDKHGEYILNNPNNIYIDDSDALVEQCVWNHSYTN